MGIRRKYLLLWQVACILLLIYILLVSSHRISLFSQPSILPATKGYSHGGHNASVTDLPDSGKSRSVPILCGTQYHTTF